MRVGPGRSVVLPVEEQLTSTPQLLPHDHRQEPDGLGHFVRVVAVLIEQDHDKQIGLLRVDPLDLALGVASRQ